MIVKKKPCYPLSLNIKAFFAKHNLLATATTGRLIKENTGLDVTTYLSGPLGGTNK